MEEGAVERACKTLVNFAATHRGATEDVQFVLDGAGIGPIESEERRIRYREWYWRRAFELLFLSIFKENDKLLPMSPFIGVSWEVDFKRLCAELNGATVTARRLQRVEWTQRKLDEWWHRWHVQMPNLAALLEFVGASTTAGTMENYQRIDQALGSLVQSLALMEGWLPVEQVESISNEIQALRAQGARLIEE